MLDIKKKAIDKFKEMIKEEGGNKVLRIFTMGGCCGGNNLMLDIVEKPLNEDIPLELEGLTVYLHREAAVLLDNATMDCNKSGEIIIKGLPKPQGGSCCG